MHDGRDHEERREVDEEEAAAEDADVAAGRRREGVVRERPQQHEHADQPGEVERDAHAASGSAADLVRREEERHRRTEQQARQARVE